MSRRYKRYTKNEIAQHIENQVSSNLTIFEYCKKHNLVYQTFCNWKKACSKNTSKFIQLTLPAQSCNVLEIQLPNGIQVKIDSEEQITLVQKLMRVSHA